MVGCCSLNILNLTFLLLGIGSLFESEERLERPRHPVEAEAAEEAVALVLYFGVEPPGEGALVPEVGGHLHAEDAAATVRVVVISERRR